MTSTDLTRRTVLGAFGGGAATVLAGCGSDAVDTGKAPATEEIGVAVGTALVATADVPIGSGVILESQKVVVSQPTKGTFVAFSAICPHQGCPVGTITGDEILCKCHGSVFSATDGSVVSGPAEEPLAATDVAVDGDQVVQA